MVNKHVSKAKAINLGEVVQYQRGSVVSREIINKQTGMVTGYRMYWINVQKSKESQRTLDVLIRGCSCPKRQYTIVLLIIIWP